MLTTYQFAAIQWVTDFYPAGKTSIDSKFNIPGKTAWFLMVRDIGSNESQIKRKPSCYLEDALGGFGVGDG